jgi:hypothetical protein
MRLCGFQQQHSSDEDQQLRISKIVSQPSMVWDRKIEKATTQLNILIAANDTMDVSSR